MKKLTYQVEKQKFDFLLNGETEVGENEVLISKDLNLIADTPWAELGFTIANFLNPKDLSQIKAGITRQVANSIQAFGGSVDEDFCLERYHAYVSDDIHLKIARITSDGWDTNLFPIDFEKVNQRISEIIGKKVTEAMPPKGGRLYCLRLVRPGIPSDSNPPHRDVWLDILRNAVNIYVPLAGSNELSSLPLLPGSHMLPEKFLVRTKKGAVVNGNQYTVPCVVSINDSDFQLIRPNPRENEVMVFSPYLVHGGGTNLNGDVTRVSLEVRFWLN